LTTPRFERDRLRLARELAKLSQAQVAAKLAVTPAAVSQFESGAARPSPATVDRLAAVFNVPAAFFEKAVTETHEGFFRSLRRTAVADRRRARAIAHVAHDLAVDAARSGEMPANSVPRIPVKTLDAGRDEIDQIVAEVRSRWRIPPGPIPHVVRLLEDHGVTVVRLPLGTIDVDAFSLPFVDHPVVVLGSDKSDRARARFDGAHELGHLVMHGDQIWGVQQVETQAHQFAAELLLPAREVREQLPRTVDWQQLFALKQRWQVSLAALLMRARTLGVMSESTYLTAVKTASARGWRRLEPVPLGSPEEPTCLRGFVGLPAGREAQAQLPSHIVEALVAS
jgi:Zn-dependent peptidase ImmA (M78 family)/transcriptional regulator with XRE-family HTH domain